VPHNPTRLNMKSQAEVEAFLQTLRGYHQAILAAEDGPVPRMLGHYISALEWVLNKDVQPLDEFLRASIGDLLP
jgi:hypothetical protein